MTQPKSAVGTAGGGTPAAARFCLTFQREPLSVPVTRHVLGGILHSVGMDDDSVSDLLLAATEACSNVLRHGGPRVTGYAVLVTIGATRCEVEIAGDCSFGGSGGHDSPRRAMGAGRLPRPSPGVTLEGGRRRAGRTLRLTPRKVSSHGSAGGSAASGPARGDSAADRRRAAREPDVARLAESGRGLDIIRACVDDLTLRTRPGRGTVVTLRRRIGWAADAPLTRMRAAS
ncbi:MAG TPA: ATP-binding protein [Streptosporangiaceae bacterium]|nr:ATP-binding protein [Streptosporangiaceae bacterium]